LLRSVEKVRANDLHRPQPHKARKGSMTRLAFYIAPV
jgi:hypothetical protein